MKPRAAERKRSPAFSKCKLFIKEEDMIRKSEMVKTVVLLLILSITVFTACREGYRQIVIVDDSNASLHVLMEGNAPEENKLWEPGRVVIFKTDCLAMFPEPLPLGNDTYFGGRAGYIYELDDNLKPKEIGTFDLKLSDDELIQRYAK